MKKVTFIFTFISIYFLLNAQIEPLDIAKLKSVSSIEISEDGKYVAYTVSEPADPLKENSSASFKLYLLNTETETSVPFVTQGSVRNFRFRPNHSSITFLSRRQDKYTSLYEIPITGGEARKIFSFKSSINSYNWSSDGKMLAFLAKEPKKTNASEFDYQPIIFEENLSFTRAYIADIEKNNVEQLNIEGNVSGLTLSPMNDKIACYLAPTPLIDDHYMKRKLVIVDVKSKKQITEIDHKGKKGNISWNTDGGKIAFIAGADINDPTDGRLFIVSDKGGKPKNILPNFKGRFDGISWTDANTIKFMASEGVWSSCGTIKADDSGIKRFIKAGEFSIRSMKYTKNGFYAFIIGNSSHPSELYIMKHKAKKPIRVTNVNPWLDKKKLAKQELIIYKAKDGLEIQALLIHPLNGVKGKKYPLIVVVHGGPESHYDNTWLTSYSNPGQLAATEGFAVFYPNYRGSTGRGLEFAKTSQVDPAGKEFDDIIDGIDHLINIGLVDKNKVGVTGGSYGGYATGWLSTKYSERFAAGVMFVGISNLISKWGTTDIPNEEYYVHALKWIWEDYDFWLKRSPIYYADKAKTPLLIMGGKIDTRVHPGQSMELYRHIKERTNTPVRLVIYPGEGHANRKSTARLDYNLRMMRWFEKYLLGKNISLNESIKLKYE